MADMAPKTAMKVMKKPAKADDEGLDFKVEHKWTDDNEYHYGHVQMDKKQTVEDCFFGVLDTQYGIKDFNDVIMVLNCSIFWYQGKTIDPRKTFKQLQVKNGDTIKVETRKYEVIDEEAPAPKPKFQTEAKHKMEKPDLQAF